MRNIFFVINKKNLVSLIICFVLLFSHIFLYSKIDGYKKVIDSVNKQIFNSFTENDVNLYDNDNNIYFVFNGEIFTLTNERPKLYLPSFEEYVLEDGMFKFNLSDHFVIHSAGKGVVTNVGYLDNGLKFVEIRHSGGIVTRYENLKIVGVGINFIVKKTNILGTGEIENNFTFKVYYNNVLIKNIKTNEKGEILWEN